MDINFRPTTYQELMDSVAQLISEDRKDEVLKLITPASKELMKGEFALSVNVDNQINIKSLLYQKQQLDDLLTDFDSYTDVDDFLLCFNSTNMLLADLNNHLQFNYNNDTELEDFIESVDLRANLKL